MNILLSTLAVFYLTLLITNADGAFEILEKLRAKTREYRGLNLDCFLCTVFWVALPFALLITSGITVLVYWFGLAGGAVIINEVFGGQE